ncbi:5-oxoprolinase subunit PxpA [Chitinibacter bivalviorum]|uniref:5-oxoprolinase subunit PxpA n=1 Tax=Chitinibacter bivalviorum TaxID=2739434 RepID=A0A7H9BFE0_9NEIS|nr:5-oxoprolinase subunit PxpA [Chitinibacter bivalviorum]QLG86908.1 5-oxoprolinase subunit PxpA [Chitinibacter bivalviorum]
MKTHIDLNADLGEGYPLDADLMAIISSANIACGGHAGNVDSIRATVRLAHQHGVRIGAHPSYPDREGFGRKSMAMTPSQLVFSLTAQLWAIKAVSIEECVSISYVKPHGALYNDAVRDPELAQQIANLIREIDPDLALMGLAGSELIKAGREAGLQVIEEGFADRAYLPDGTLMPREQEGAVLHDANAVLVQALELSQHVDSLCLHGDNPAALAQAIAIRDGLRSAGIRICAFSDPRDELVGDLPLDAMIDDD